MVAWRRGGAFCNGIVCTACRGGCFFRMKVCKRIFGSRWWSPSASRSHRRVTACTPTRRGKVCGRLTASRRLCRVQSRYGSPPRRSFCSYKRNQNTLGAVPQDPLTLKLRLDTNDVNIVRTAPQIRSQGACGAFYFGFCRNQIKNQPYKRRRVGRNLRLSRADPALCSGQPSPLRCILLSPQGLTTLRGPRLYGVYRRVGFLGRSPE